MKLDFVSVLCVVCVAASAAGADEPKSAGPPQKPLVFWHTQAQSNARLLQEIVDEYNAGSPPAPVELRYAGNYTTLFQKVRAAIPTGKLPELVVAYESMVAEYIESDAVVPLDDYINDPEIGLSKESLADIFPRILENNRYPAYGDKYYTFPFTKSVLMMYYNADMLEQAGFDRPPETWKEFKEQCLAVKDKLGKKGYALSVDASTVDAMVMSFGGRVLSSDRRRALFDRPAGVAAFRLIYDLARSGAAYQIDRASYGDRKDFSSGNCAFMIRSSTTRPYVEGDIKGRFNWDMAIIPHAQGEEPVTVLFGANVAVMKTPPQRQRAAWQFVKYFCSKHATAKWATGTGYLPVRKSAAQTDRVKAFFAQAPRNIRAFDALPHARTEPGVLGWQAVRTQIELAESRAVGGRTLPEKIANELNKKANAALARTSGEPPPRGEISLLVVPALAAVLVIILFTLKARRARRNR